MKFSIINGSPRGKSSNSRIILEKVLEGFNSVESSYIFEDDYLKTSKDQQKIMHMFETSDILIIAFPLYTDAMPGIVKQLIEAIDISKINKNLRLGFIVQSGFPESYHSEFVRNYLKKLCKRIKVEYIGTAIKGGVEGLKIQPKWMTQKYMSLFYQLGRQLAINWVFDVEIMEKLAQPRHLKGSRLFFTKVFIKLGMANFYWNSQLKQNKIFDQRFAKPYTE